MASDKPRDPYEVLGVSTTATDEQIKSAYRKLALKFHPDKNQGPNAQAASESFQEVVTAYGILSDPQKKHKYDQGGFDNLNPSDMQVEVDLTSLGFVNTAMAAFFSKLGVPIKTAVSQSVLEAAYSGQFTALPLQFGQKQTDEVKKAGVVFYEMAITQQHIDDGFAIGAHSPTGSRFKLLLFEQAKDGQWELLVQEDSCKSKKGWQMAGLYMFPWHTCSIGSKPSALETASNLEAQLFQHLESMQPREAILVRPGRLLVAVYGDNWFNKVKFTVQAVHTPGLEACAAQSAQAVRQVEAQLLQKKSELRQFESQYRQAKAQFEAAVQRFNTEQKEVDQLLQSREEAYLDLLAINESKTSLSNAAQHNDFTAKGWGRRRG